MPTKNNYAQWLDSFEQNSRRFNDSSEDTLGTAFKPKRARAARGRDRNSAHDSAEGEPSYRVLAPEPQPSKVEHNKLDNRAREGWLEPEPIFEHEDTAPNSSPADALLDDDVFDDLEDGVSDDADGYSDEDYRDDDSVDAFEDDGLEPHDVRAHAAEAHTHGAAETHASATYQPYEDAQAAAETDHPHHAARPYRRRINLIDGLVSAYVIIMAVWLIREMFLR